jgi:hypothetical protein
MFSFTKRYKFPDRTVTTDTQHHIVEMESANSPRRVVLRFDAKYDLQEPAIITQYLASIQSGEISYFIHSIPPSQSHKAHTVLDLHYIENPTANLDEIPYEVFLVKKQADLYVVPPILKPLF